MAAAAACAPLPFYVYEFAATAGYALDPSMLARLREEAENVTGMKVSDSPWDAFERYLLDGFDIFVGPEALIHRGREAGAVGAVSALASAFPEEVAAVVREPTEDGAARLGELRSRIESFPRHAALKRVVGWKASRSGRTCEARSVISMRARWRPWRGGSHRRSGCAPRERCLPGERGAARGDPPCRRRQARQAVHAPLRDASRRGSLRRGERLDECVVVLRRLAAQGLHANTTLLGESVRDRAEAEAVADEYGRILGRLHAERLPVNVALKLTHLGLELDEELAYANVERVVRVAERLQSFVRIDMEQSSVVDATLRIYRRLREAGHDRVGTVLQSYLYRSQADLESLLPLQPNLRFVKGAYLEPPEIAYAAKPEVDAAFARLVETALRGGGYAAVATHDERLVDHCIDFAAREGIPRDRFELQMLYGVRPALQLEARPARSDGSRGDALRPGVVPVPDAAPGGAARQPRLLRAPRSPLRGSERVELLVQVGIPPDQLAEVLELGGGGSSSSTTRSAPTRSAASFTSRCSAAEAARAGRGVRAAGRRTGLPRPAAEDDPHDHSSGDAQGWYAPRDAADHEERPEMVADELERSPDIRDVGDVDDRVAHSASSAAVHTPRASLRDGGRPS